jgi:hypothetical protein
MTETFKRFNIFIDMRIHFKHILGQLIILVFLPVFVSCSGKKDESQASADVIPPVTSPLSREYIGYGVITASFTHVTEDPAEDGRYLGYLRRGTLVPVLRRQMVKSNNRFTTWVLVDGTSPGWLKEEVMVIYDNESQARTASQLASPESSGR